MIFKFYEMRNTFGAARCIRHPVLVLSHPRRVRKDPQDLVLGVEGNYTHASMSEAFSAPPGRRIGNDCRLNRFWMLVPAMEGREVARIPGLTKSRCPQIPIWADLARHGPQIAP